MHNNAWTNIISRIRNDCIVCCGIVPLALHTTEGDNSNRTLLWVCPTASYNHNFMLSQITALKAMLTVRAIQVINTVLSVR